MSKNELAPSKLKLYKIHFTIDESSMMYTHVAAESIGDVERQPGVEIKLIEPLGSFWQVTKEHSNE